MLPRNNESTSQEARRPTLEARTVEPTAGGEAAAVFDIRAGLPTFGNGVNGVNGVSRGPSSAGSRDTVRCPRLVSSKCAAIKRLLGEIEVVARTPATVLITGETGVGKDVFAQAIHDSSPRRQRPMIRVNCGAIPATLLESEFFGHERGAYTGAFHRQIGRFEAAHQSTLLLDEIGELPPAAQVKLLRVLQGGTIERLGSSQSIKIDVRIIAATNIDLEQAVGNGTFREDLFYRLNVFPMAIPPLRERIEDIPALAWDFVDEFSRRLNKRVDSISPESIREMQHYRWPGNVRELRNLIERSIIVANGPVLTVPCSNKHRGAVSSGRSSLQAS